MAMVTAGQDGRGARDGRVVVVLGASSGIGRACALAFAGEGARLALAARGSEALHDVARACEGAGAGATLVAPTDVLDGAAVGRLVDRAVEAFGGVDVMVHTANVMAYGRIEEVPPEVFERVVDTAVHGTANVARAVLPAFRARGSGTLVIVTSLLASVPVPSMGAYIAGKWGQLGLARVLQVEARDDPGISVCTVSPGAVDTPIFRRAANFAGFVGRPPPPVMSPERVAAAVVRSADHPRKRRSVGPANVVVLAGFRLLPWLYDRIVGPLARAGAFTREPVGPTPGNVFTSSSSAASSPAPFSSPAPGTPSATAGREA